MYVKRTQYLENGEITMSGNESKIENSQEQGLIEEQIIKEDH